MPVSIRGMAMWAGVAFFSAGVLLAHDARAERPFVPCSNPQIFRGAAVNFVMLPYTVDEDEPDANVSLVSQQVAHLLGNLSLVGALPLTSVGVIEMVSDPESSGCTSEAVLPKVRGQLALGQGLILVSGRLFMIQETAYLTTTVRFERFGRSEDWQFGLEGQFFRVELGAQALTFPARRLARGDLSAAQEEFRNSQFLYDSPDTSSSRRPLASQLERPGDFSMEVLEWREGWLRVRTSESGEGWLPTGKRLEVDDFARHLPELRFIQGLAGYLRFRQGLTGRWSVVSDGGLAVAREALERYEAEEDDGAASTARGVSGQMLALMDLLQPGAGDREVSRARRALAAAVEAAPASAGVIGMQALLNLREQVQAGLAEWKPAETEVALKRALAADPKSEQASDNLSAFYRLVDSTRTSRRTLKRYEVSPEKVVIGQQALGQINALVRGSPDSSSLGRKYNELGAANGFLGPPVADEAYTYDKKGRYREYQGGSIFWSSETGAHEVHGLIRDKWRSLAAEGGFLGFPVTDETATPDSVGRYNHFQRGSIYWIPATGAFEVHGLIRGRWAEMGWERSVLGYPVTDETATQDGTGRFNHFQNGSIYWTPATGAHEVFGDIRDRWKSLGWERSSLGYPTTGVLVAPDGVNKVQHFQSGVIRWNPDKGVSEEE